MSEDISNIGDSTFVSSILAELDAHSGNTGKQKPDSEKIKFPSHSGIKRPHISNSKSVTPEDSDKLNLITARARVIQLETELQELNREAKRVKYQQELDILSTVPKSCDLQLEVENLKVKYQQARAKAEEAEQARKSIESDWKNQVATLKREKLQVKSQLTETEHSLRATRSQLEYLEKQKEMLTKIQEIKYLEVENQYKDQVKISAESNKQIEEELTPLKEKCKMFEEMNKELETSIQKYEDDRKIVAATKDKILQYIEKEKLYQSMTVENEKLREKCLYHELLKEKAYNLDVKMQRNEDRMNDYAVMKAKNEELQQNLQKWKKFDSSAIAKIGFASPDNLLRKYCDMQQQMNLLTEKIGILQADLKVAESKTQSISQELAESKSQLDIEKNAHKNKSEQYQRLERKLIYITMDRDSYRDILSSYERSDTSKPDVILQMKAKLERAESTLSKSQERIKELESEIESLQDNKNCTSIDFTIVCGQVTTLSTKIENKNGIIDRLRKEVGWYEVNVKLLRTQSSQLEAQLTAANNQIKNQQYQSNTTGTSAGLPDSMISSNNSTSIWLRLKNSPLAKAKQDKIDEIIKLREDNKQLHAALEAEGSDNNMASDDTKNSAQELLLKKEIEELEEKLKKADLKESRLKESFSKRVQEFRDACFMLTGYRIDINVGGKYKVYSLYAESADDYLMFILSQGVMSIISTKYSDKIKSQIDNYVGQHSSIPALLSDLTLELVKKSTILLSFTTDTKQ